MLEISIIRNRYNHLLFNLMFMLGASLVVAVNAVKRGAAAEGMKLRDYVWRGHDPTSVAVMTEVISYWPIFYL